MRIHPNATLRRFILLSLLAITTQANAQPASCRPEWNARWEFVRNEQTGLALAASSAGIEVGPYAASKKAAFLKPGAVWGKNWFPVDGFKHTVCGKVETFEVFDPIISGAETDFHIFFKLGAPFEYALADLKAVTGSSRFYGEVTLPKPLRSVPWFRKVGSSVAGSSPTELVPAGSPACGYGTWVVEEAHGMQPELHPMEQFWFRDASTLHWVSAVDVSNRFDRKEYYCGIGTPKADCSKQMNGAAFEPWSWPAREVVAMVPFETGPTNATLTGVVAGGSASASVTPNGATTGGELPGQLSIQPVQVCSQGGTVRGYFKVSATAKDQYTYVRLRTGPSSGEAVDLKKPVLITRVPGGGYTAPALDRTGEPAKPPGVAMRINAEIDDVDAEKGVFEFDISPEYFDPSGGDDNPLVQYLTGALYGVVPEGLDGSGALLQKRENYRSAFGAYLACFEPATQAELDGRPVPVAIGSECVKGTGLRICREESPCGFQDDGDLVDYRVLGATASGTLNIHGSVKDPSGLEAPFALSVNLPVTPTPPAEALVESLITEAQLSSADDRLLRSWAPSASHPGVDNVSLTCDAKARAARTFWMFALTYTRHGVLDAPSAKALAQILRNLKNARTTCG